MLSKMKGSTTLAQLHDMCNKLSLANESPCDGCPFSNNCIENPGSWRLDNEPIAPVPQAAKSDADKPRPSLVPPAAVLAIAKVREYGTAKYHDPENWKKVSKERHFDAAYRHMLRSVEDIGAVDAESGLPNIYHALTDLAFIAAMLWEEGEPHD